ncbi:MAG: AsmA-like C-terminal region-containing protein, partial [Neisseriaceae bacterium]|nr:AsmA-like C-terminal region-containing protein [Neisseriaceae bacterium]
KTIKYKIEQKLNNLNIGVMLFYFTNFPFLSGNGNSYISLQTEGYNISEILSNLNGFSSFEIHQGVILGSNLEKIIYAQGKLGTFNTQTLELSRDNQNKELEQTQFDLFKFVSYWTNGVSETVALEIDGPEFQVRGQGATDLVNQSLDYSLLLTGDVNKMEKKVDINIPIKLAGDLLEPKYYLDSKQVLELLDGSENKEEVLRRFIKQQWELIR